MYAYAYGISYTIHTLHDQYHTGDYNRMVLIRGSGAEII